MSQCPRPQSTRSLTITPKHDHDTGGWPRAGLRSHEEAGGSRVLYGSLSGPTHGIIMEFLGFKKAGKGSTLLLALGV